MCAIWQKTALSRKSAMTHDSLLDAAGFIATLKKRQGLMVACPEVIAYRQCWISAETVRKLTAQLSKNGYDQYLRKIIKDLNISAQPTALSHKMIVE